MRFVVILFCVCRYGVAVYAQPVVASITVKNEVTGSPIDAHLRALDEESVKRVSKGTYTMRLESGLSEELTIEQTGYFDKKVKLEYSVIRSNQKVEVKLTPEIPQLRVTILDEETHEEITSAIDLFNLHDSTLIFSEKVEVAPYTIDLEYNVAHVLQVRAPGYFSFKDTIDFSGVFDGRVREKRIGLVPLKAGNKISLNNIHFQPNDASLTDFARLMLVELTHVLEQQKNIVIARPDVASATADRPGDPS